MISILSFNFPNMTPVEFILWWMLGSVIFCALVCWGGLRWCRWADAKHFEVLLKEAEESAEREGRNRTFPKDGKAIRIWK